MKYLHRDQDKKTLILRLKRVEGQLRGVQRLIDDDAPCESVAQQLSAARRALDKVHYAMLGCLIGAQLTEEGATASDTKSLVDMLSRYG